MKFSALNYCVFCFTFLALSGAVELGLADSVVQNSKTEERSQSRFVAVEAESIERNRKQTEIDCAKRKGKVEHRLFAPPDQFVCLYAASDAGRLCLDSKDCESRICQWNVETNSGECSDTVGAFMDCQKSKFEVLGGKRVASATCSK